MGKAWQAYIDREYASLRILVGHLARMKSCSAACDKNFAIKLLIAVRLLRISLGENCSMRINDPTRIRIFLVLMHDLNRHAVIDRS